MAVVVYWSHTELISRRKHSTIFLIYQMRNIQIYDLFAITSCPLFSAYHADLDVGTVEVDGLVSVEVS